MPTCGRSTLARAITSVTSQLNSQDELIVIGDGAQGMARREALRHGAIYAETPRPTKAWGNAQRQLGLHMANGNYLAFCDDDDAMVPGAIRAIRNAIAVYPERPLMFRMDVSNYGFAKIERVRLLWRRPKLEQGNVGTPMFVVPNVRERLGSWDSTRHEQDFHFITQTVERYSTDALVWLDDVICICRPSEDITGEQER